MLHQSLYSSLLHKIDDVCTMHGVLSSIVIIIGIQDAFSLLRSASAKLTQPISTTLYAVTDSLYAQGLIPLDTKEDMYEGEGNNVRKAGRLLIALQKLLEASSNREQYLINVCYILLSQKLVPLKEITVPILKELGKCMNVMRNKFMISSINFR